MESRKSKEEYEIKILSIFTDISNFQDKNSIEFQKLIQKYIHQFGNGHSFVLMNMMYEMLE